MMVSILKPKLKRHSILKYVRVFGTGGFSLKRENSFTLKNENDYTL